MARVRKLIACQSSDYVLDDFNISPSVDEPLSIIDKSLHKAEKSSILEKVGAIQATVLCS
jgi:hypothetical protein